MDKDIGRFLHLKHKTKPGKKTLESIRKFLDSNNIKMPRPKYIYKEEDKTTWKWLDIIFSEDGGYQMAVPNQHFKYKDR